jgi:hypothetical protein
MKGLLASLTLAASICSALAACGMGDDTVEGGRAQCAFGGALTDCPDAELTSEGACWRLVDCGAIPLEVDDPTNEFRFDWGRCVDDLDTMIEARRRPIVQCVAASTCDELRTANYCYEFGSN